MRANATTCASKPNALQGADGRSRREFVGWRYKLTPELNELVKMVKLRMARERYSNVTRTNYCSNIRRFLNFLRARCIAIDAVQPEDIQQYLRQLRRGGGTLVHMRQQNRSAVAFLMGTVRTQWPPPKRMSADEQRDASEVAAFDRWMTDVRGLAPQTRRRCRAGFAQLQAWCRDTSLAVPDLTLQTTELYLKSRATVWSRTTIAREVGVVRTILRFLKSTRRIKVDFGWQLESPRNYRLPGIPSAPSQKDIERALKVSAARNSPLGIRDHAIFTLLVTYGFRAGEIVDLKIDDIDWRRDQIRIVHRKSRVRGLFPLKPIPGNAIIRYLREARPTCDSRSLFIRSFAPYRGLQSTSALYGGLTRIFAEAGIERTGKKGAHSIRHARAISLLRNGANLKTIGDLLGHTALSSTAIYLKLATEDLRRLSLNPRRQESV